MRYILVPVAIGAIVLSVAGCSTAAQREATRIQSVEAEYKASGDACIQSISNNPDYASIKLKTPTDTPPQFLLQMLNDKTSPTKKEIALLYRVYSDIQECRKIYLDGAAKMHPLILTGLVEAYSANDKLWAQMTAGQLTWGQFNQGREDIYNQTREKQIQAVAQIGSQLQNQNQAELDQRQRAAAAFQQWAYQQQQIAVQQQAIAAANRPRMINCSYFGNAAQCTSN